MSYSHIYTPHKPHRRWARRVSLIGISAALLYTGASATPPSTNVSTQPSSQVTPPAVSPEARERDADEQRRAVTAQVSSTVERLKQACPNLKITQRASSLSPNLALKMALPLEGADGAAKADSFLSRFSGLWTGLEVKVSGVIARRGRSYATLQASISELPVLNQDARLMIDDQGRAQHLSSALSAVYQVKGARRSEADALRVALSHLQLPLDAPHVTRLGYIVHAGVATAAYEVQAGGQATQAHPVVLVDAVEGVVLNVSDRVRR